MHPQELGAADHLHSRVVDEKWSMTGLVLPEVDNDFFSFYSYIQFVVPSCTSAGSSSDDIIHPTAAPSTVGTLCVSY